MSNFHTGFEGTAMNILNLPVPLKLWELFLAMPLMGYAIGNIAAKVI